MPDTLKQKIGQMLIVGFRGEKLTSNNVLHQAISQQQVGGVILFDYNFETKTYHNNILDPHQLKKLTVSLQKLSVAPLFVSIDYEGGKVNRLKSQYGFPETLSAAALGKKNLKTASAYAMQMAETLKNTGINLNFAPVLDLNIEKQNRVISKLERSFSDNPELVTQYAKIFIETYQRNNIIPVLKHFPGHGSSIGDTHDGLVDVTHSWKKEELFPYEFLLKDCKHHDFGVLTSHVVHRKLDKKAYPASLSHGITTGLLRESLGFDGVVFTDDLQMKAITNHYGLADAVRLSILAGADALTIGNQLGDFIGPAEIVQSIYDDVKNNRIPKQRIEESFHRIKQLKEKFFQT